MHDFHRKIADDQRREGVRVITAPHPLGFLDPSLPEKSRPLTGESPLPSGTARAQG
jgi:hypothetical protein